MGNKEYINQGLWSKVSEPRVDIIEKDLRMEKAKVTDLESKLKKSHEALKTQLEKKACITEMETRLTELEEKLLRSQGCDVYCPNANCGGINSSQTEGDSKERSCKHCEESFDVTTAPIVHDSKVAINPVVRKVRCPKCNRANDNAFENARRKCVILQWGHNFGCGEVFGAKDAKQKQTHR